jgi:hypothetical protein
MIFFHEKNIKLMPCVYVNKFKEFFCIFYLGTNISPQISKQYKLL